MSQVVEQRDVLGRGVTSKSGPVADVGRFLARDGSLGGPVGFDLDRPHVVSIFGKRGSGKSHTLGVLAEELAASPGVTGVVVDTMGVYGGLAAVGARVVEAPAVAPSSIPARHWPAVVGLDPVSPAGSLVWRAAETATTVEAMRDRLRASSADPAVARTADTHLGLAESWACFDASGLDDSDLCSDELTVLDCSHLPDSARVAVVAAVARLVYAHATTDAISTLPWLLIDEAHACYAGPAREALDTLLTRGRQPGVSVALATQRPGSLPAVAISQTDLLVSHRLTLQADVDALARTQPTYLTEAIATRLPDRTGDALVVDDASESIATIRVRDRHTPDGGASPRASRRSRTD